MTPDRVDDLPAALIRRVRTITGETQADLAKRVGISRPSLSNIEAGRQEISLRTWLPVLLDAGLLSLAEPGPNPLVFDRQMDRALQAIDAAVGALQATRQWLESARPQVP